MEKPSNMNMDETMDEIDPEPGELIIDEQTSPSIESNESMGHSDLMASKTDQIVYELKKVIGPISTPENLGGLKADLKQMAEWFLWKISNDEIKVKSDQFECSTPKVITIAEIFEHTNYSPFLDQSSGNRLENAEIFKQIIEIVIKNSTIEDIVEAFFFEKKLDMNFWRNSLRNWVQKEILRTKKFTSYNLKLCLRPTFQWLNPIIINCLREMRSDSPMDLNKKFKEFFHEMIFKFFHTFMSCEGKESFTLEMIKLVESIVSSYIHFMRSINLGLPRDPEDPTSYDDNIDYYHGAIQFPKIFLENLNILEPKFLTVVHSYIASIIRYYARKEAEKFFKIWCEN